MNNSDLIDTVATAHDLSKADAKKIIDGVISAIVDAATCDGNVTPKAPSLSVVVVMGGRGSESAPCSARTRSARAVRGCMPGKEDAWAAGNWHAQSPLLKVEGHLPWQQYGPVFLRYVLAAMSPRHLAVWRS